MAIGEFEEVGNVVRAFAADDATVVVGTAIDEALEGELRVTVVATGLGQQQQGGLRAVPKQQVQSRVASGGGGSGPSYSQQGGNGGATTAGASRPAAQIRSPYEQYDNKPQVTRKSARGSAQGTSSATDGHDVEYLDIPAFLRRQAD